MCDFGAKQTQSLPFILAQSPTYIVSYQIPNVVSHTSLCPDIFALEKLYGIQIQFCGFKNSHLVLELLYLRQSSESGIKYMNNGRPIQAFRNNTLFNNLTVQKINRSLLKYLKATLKRV